MNKLFHSLPLLFVSFLCMFPLSAKKNSLASASATVSSQPKALSQPLLSSHRTLVNKVVARVNGANLLLSDMLQPRIDRGGNAFVSKDDYERGNTAAIKKGLEDFINEELLFQKAYEQPEQKLLPSDTDIEKHIAALKASQGLTDMSPEAFEKELAKEGLTVKGYRTQLFRVLAIERVKQVELSERLVVTAREAEAYYNSHKEQQEELYTLKIATVKTKQPLTQQEILSKKDLVWDQLAPIERSKIASHMSFVFDMHEGDVSAPLATPVGYQLVMLAKKEPARVKTLQEQYVKIEKLLHAEKRARFEHELINDLRNPKDPNKKPLIVYL